MTGSRQFWYRNTPSLLSKCLKRKKDGLFDRDIGFEEVSFEFEPVAAAYQYEHNLDHENMDFRPRDHRHRQIVRGRATIGHRWGG